MVHYNILVTGKVQGVFYRASAQQAAEQLGVTGFVRNQPDGSVYIEAEGDEDQLEQLVAWCRKGPPAAKVEKVVVSNADLVQFRSFDIRR